MLVLSRRINEEIVIDNHIRIRVVQVAGGKVRIGIEAPRDVAIHRAELELRPEEHADAQPLLESVAVATGAVARRSATSLSLAARRPR